MSESIYLNVELGREIKMILQGIIIILKTFDMDDIVSVMGIEAMTVFAEWTNLKHSMMVFHN